MRVYQRRWGYWWAQIDGTLAGAGAFSRERAIRKALKMHAQQERNKRARNREVARSTVEYREPPDA